MPAAPYDAIVLAGGRARRLGGVDKPALEFGGVTLLARVVAAVGGADRVVVVGPRRPVPREVIWTREDPVGGGPVAALAAGLTHVRAAIVVVLAADLPAIGPAVAVLRARLEGDDGAVLVDEGGRVNYLAAAWRRDRLAAALAAVGDPDGASMRRVVAGLRYELVTDDHGWGRDCDTWDDVAAAQGAAQQAAQDAARDERPDRPFT